MSSKYGVGTIHTNNHGEKFIIVERLPKQRVLIKFLENNDYDYVKEVGVPTISVGKVSNPYKPTVIIDGQLIGVRGVVDGLNVTSKETQKWYKVLRGKKQYPQEWKVLEFFIRDVRKTKNYDEWVKNEEQLILRAVYENNFIVGFEVCIGCNYSKPLQIKCLYDGNIEQFNSIQHASEELGWFSDTIKQYCDKNEVIDGYEYSWLKYGE